SKLSLFLLSKQLAVGNCRLRRVTNMKTQMIGVLSLALLTVESLFAEMTPRMTAHIPFGFHVGNSVLPAGEYTVDTEPGPGLVRLRSADCKSSVTIIANAVQTYPTPRDSKLKSEER